jgi:WD40 repeat protein
MTSNTPHTENILHTAFACSSEITCLDANKYILTGCIDGTTRLWDTRQQQHQYKSIQCYKVQGEVSNCKFSTINDHMIYITSGTNIHFFDRRMEKVIVNDPVSTLVIPNSTNSEDDNDINSVNFNKNGTKMIVSDDCGMVHFISLQVEEATGKIDRSFKAHDNICITAKYLKNDEQFISGGLDYKVSLYNAGKNNKKPLVWSFPFNQAQLMPQNTKADSKQLVNPPLVQCLDMHPTVESRIAVGLANGKCALMDTTKDATQIIVGSLEGHDYILNQIEFVKDCDKNKTLLFTCGYDNKIILWDAHPLYSKAPTLPATSTTKKSTTNKQKKKTTKQQEGPAAQIKWQQSFPVTKEKTHISCFKHNSTDSTVIVAYGTRAGIFQYNI